jgi:hypothetical protein
MDTAFLPSFAASAVPLQLHALAYNLATRGYGSRLKNALGGSNLGLTEASI